MLSKIITAMLLIVAVIHLLPVLGVLGVERLRSLYGVAIADPNLALLMRHRAVLFGIVGALLIVAAFVPAWQVFATALAAVSVLSYCMLYWATPGTNAELRTVFNVDLVAAVCLLIAGVCLVLRARS